MLHIIPSATSSQPETVLYQDGQRCEPSVSGKATRPCPSGNNSNTTAFYPSHTGHRGGQIENLWEAEFTTLFPAPQWSQLCVPFLPCLTVESVMCPISSLPHCGVSYVSHFFPASPWSQMCVPFLPCFTVESAMCAISSLFHSGVTFCVPFLPCFTVVSPMCPISSLLHRGATCVSHFFPAPQWSQLGVPFLPCSTVESAR